MALQSRVLIFMKRLEKEQKSGGHIPAGRQVTIKTTRGRTGLVSHRSVRIDATHPGSACVAQVSLFIDPSDGRAGPVSNGAIRVDPTNSGAGFISDRAVLKASDGGSAGASDGAV